MRKLASVIGLSVLGFSCQRQPAAAPLPAPAPAATDTAASAAAAPAVAKPAPLPPDQIAKAYLDCWAAFNAKDWTKFGGCFAENATSESVDSGAPPLSGRANLIEKGAKTWATAFPDGTGELQLTLVNGRHVTGVVLFRGINTGPLASPDGELKPTNKKLGQLFAHQVELTEDGRLVQRERIVMDAGTMMGQLGLMPGPHRKALETGWPEKPVVIAINNDAEQANLAAVRQSAEAFNKHDVPALVANLTDDVVLSDLATAADRTGKKEVQRAFEDLFKGFPDLKLDVKNAWAAGDYVVSEGSLSGTNTGDLPATKLKKTGKAINVQYVQIDKLQGGKIKKTWIFSNGMAFASQLGLLPQPKADPKAAPGAKPGDAKPGATPANPAAPSSATPAAGPAGKAATPAPAAPPPSKPAATPAPAAPPAAKPAPAAPPAAPPAAKPQTPAAPPPAAPPAAPAPAAPPAQK